MDIRDALETMHYVVNAQGKHTDVLITLASWIAIS
jgi:hypothetical protein